MSPSRPASRELDDGPGTVEAGTSAGGLSRGGSRQQSRGRGSRGRGGGGGEGSDPFPPGPEGSDDEEEGWLAYQQQLAALRGEGPEGDGGDEEGAKKAAERVPQVAEKKYAIKSKAKVKSKLDDEANAQQAVKKKKRKGGGEGEGADFNAEDYEDVMVPGPRPGASPEELLLREAVVNALLAHLGTRQVGGVGGYVADIPLSGPFFVCLYLTSTFCLHFVLYIFFHFVTFFYIFLIVLSYCAVDVSPSLSHLTPSHYTPGGQSSRRAGRTHRQENDRDGRGSGRDRDLWAVPARSLCGGVRGDGRVQGAV